MAVSATAAGMTGDVMASVREAIAAKPDGVLESIAADHKVSYRAVLDCLAGDAAVAVPSSAFDALWDDMTG